MPFGAHVGSVVGHRLPGRHLPLDSTATKTDSETSAGPERAGTGARVPDRGRNRREPGPGRRQRRSPRHRRAFRCFADRSQPGRRSPTPSGSRAPFSTSARSADRAPRRRGCKGILLVGMALTIPADLVAVFAPSIGVLFAARIVGGLAAGMAYPTTLALITALWSGPARTKSIALSGGDRGGAHRARPPAPPASCSQHFSWGSPVPPHAALRRDRIFPMALRFIPANVNETTEPVASSRRRAHDLPGRRLHHRHQPGGRPGQGVRRNRVVCRLRGRPDRFLHQGAARAQPHLRPACGLAPNFLGGRNRKGSSSSAH